MFGRIFKTAPPEPSGFLRIFKKNPYHDAKGRFASKNSVGGASTDVKGTESLAEHYAKYDDPDVTAESILKRFSPRQRGEVAMAIMKANATPSSKELYTDKDGNYTEERQKLHEAIISELLSSDNITRATPERGKAPTFVVLGGRGGSGKSSFTNGKLSEFDAKKFLVLDSDDIKQRLKPPYKGWNAASVHEESSHLFDIVTEAAISMGLNVVHDTTLRSKSIESTIGVMKSNGYRVEGHYMFVPRQLSAARAVQRYLGKGPKERGRLVPVEVILGNTRNEQNFEDLKKHFSKWSAYDNQGDAPKLLSRGSTK